VHHVGKVNARHDGGTGEMMFQNFITAVMVLVSLTIAASGLPLASIFGAGSGLGFFNLSLVF
jgi:hypothetical protein